MGDVETQDMVNRVTDTPRVATGDTAIDLTDVRKRYRKVDALKGVSMKVNRGEVFGLLGPNGAGKSTLVKIMLTVVRPSHAEGTVLGEPIRHKGHLKRIGYLPEHARFPRYLTGRMVVEMAGAMHGMSTTDRKRRSNELLDTVGMTHAADRKISTYSKGMQQRIGIAQALVNDPDLVVLDEPTDGVDPKGRRDIRDVLAHLRESGKTVFVNSHLLSELEEVCDRFAIMVNGKVAQQGTLDDLTLGQLSYEIEVQLDNVEAPPTVAAPAGIDSSWSGETLTIQTIDPAVVQPVIDGLRQQSVVIRSVRMVRPSLEDVFMRVAEEGA